jgi:TRAP-type C4-dicarboxylate transport system, small permease component
MKEIIDRYLSVLLIGLMTLMTLDVLWGVFTRYVYGNQADWSEELAKFLLIWVGLLGAAYASGQKLHLTIDLITDSLSLTGKNRLALLINVLIILFAFSVLVIGGGNLMYITNILGQTSPALQLPMYLVYLVVPISGVLVVVYRWMDISNRSTPNG